MTTSTTTKRETTAKSSDPIRKASLWSGIMYLLTFVSIPTLALYESVKGVGYVTGAGPDTGVLVGGALELIVGLACIGTAVALYPVVRRQNEALAMGFVGARILEAALIFVGVASLWTIVTLRQGGAGADATLMGETLVAFYDRAFLVSQGFIPTLNALLLGSLLYRSRLVPRVLPVLGLVGAPLLIGGVAGTMFGLWEQVNVLSGVAVLFIAGWEFSLGVYLIVKGFRPAAVAELDTLPAMPGTPWAGSNAAAEPTHLDGPRGDV